MNYSYCIGSNYESNLWVWLVFFVHCSSLRFQRPLPTVKKRERQISSQSCFQTAVNFQPPPFTSAGGGSSYPESENEAASNIRLRASLCPDSLAVFFLSPDANRYRTPESSDRHNKNYEGLPKA